MLPHDEVYLKHYGVLGMHWGVRRKITKANQLERGATEIENEARKIRSGEANKYTTGKRRYEHPTKGAARREDLATAFDMAGEMDRKRAKEITDKIKRINTTPLDHRVKMRGSLRFKHAVGTSLITGGIGTLAGGLVNIPLRRLTGYALTPYGAGFIGATIGGVASIIETKDIRP